MGASTWLGVGFRVYSKERIAREVIAEIESNVLHAKAIGAGEMRCKCLLLSSMLPLFRCPCRR